jgi:hypothetical protein
MRSAFVEIDNGAVIVPLAAVSFAALYVSVRAIRTQSNSLIEIRPARFVPLALAPQLEITIK